MEFRTLADFQKHNFFRKPSWRWDRVVHMCDHWPTPRRCTRRDDDYIRAARHFLLRWKDKNDEIDRQQLFWDNPGLFYAFELHRMASMSDDAARSGALFLQARLLARQSPQEISAVSGIAPQTIEWYEKVFFNVVEFIDQRDWVTSQILIPALTNEHITVGMPADAAFKDSTVARPFLDGSLKMFSYFGGPLLADIMISGLQAGKPLDSLDNLHQWIDHGWATIVRRRSLQAAIRFEINKYNVTELFAVHTRIIELERSDEAGARDRDAKLQNIRSLIDEIPWASGLEGEKVFEKHPLRAYDEGAAELRDHEALPLAAGAEGVELKDFELKALPAPRKTKPALTGDQAPEL